jgi:hypothetical protein
MVNRYANDRIAQKYNKAVIKVRTVLSVVPLADDLKADDPDVCIFSIQFGFC